MTRLNEISETVYSSIKKKRNLQGNGRGLFIPELIDIITVPIASEAGNEASNIDINQICLVMEYLETDID